MKKSSHKNTQKRKLLKRKTTRKTTRKNTRKNQKRRGGGWFSSSKSVDNNNKNCKTFYVCKKGDKNYDSKNQKEHITDILNKGEVYIEKKNQKDFQKRFDKYLENKNQSPPAYDLYTFTGFPMKGGNWLDESSYVINGDQKNTDNGEQKPTDDILLTKIDMTHLYPFMKKEQEQKSEPIRISRRQFQKLYALIIYFNNGDKKQLDFQTYGKCNAKGIMRLLPPGDSNLPKC